MGIIAYGGVVRVYVNMGVPIAVGGTEYSINSHHSMGVDGLVDFPHPQSNYWSFNLWGFYTP